MNIKDALKILEKDKVFKDWKKKNSDFFITNVFIMLQDSNEIDKVQIGYCNKKGDK